MVCDGWGGVCRGPSVQWQGSALWSTTSGTSSYTKLSLITGLWRNWPSIKGAVKRYNQGAFSHLSSCALPRCHPAGFSLFAACLQSVFTGASIGGCCLSGWLNHVHGAWALGLPQNKLLSRKSHMTGSVLLLVTRPCPHVPATTVDCRQAAPASPAACEECTLSDSTLDLLTEMRDVRFSGDLHAIAQCSSNWNVHTKAGLGL